MITEKIKEVSAVENMTKQEMAKIIKTAKKESGSLEKETAISICDVMKNNTSEIIQKIESKFPVYTDLYTSLYTKYLHAIEDLYGTCYLSEKEFFDKSGVDKTVIQVFDAYWRTITNMILSQIDVSTIFAKTYVQFRLVMIDSYDKAVHLMMDSYARSWNQLNLYNKNSHTE